MSHAPRILDFTGDGKGKTTAALGMALRAAGHGMKTCVIQFIKTDTKVGEVLILPKLQRIEIVQTGLGFLPKPTEIMAAAQADLVILDEICVAVARGLLKEDAVIAAVRQARPDSCVVLTLSLIHI